MFRGLTQTGANYLATRLANALPVNFTKVKIGSGTAPGNPYATTNLNNYIQDAKILTKVQEENSINITVQITNENRQQGFYLKEIGVFVDDNGTEKLYWYCNEDNAQYVPAASDSAIAFEIEIKMEVTNQESTILNWSGKGTWIDREYLERELAKKENAFSKKSGFNKEKTDEYTKDDTNKVATGKALKKLYDWIRGKLATLTLSWDRITNKPNLTTTENLTQLLKGKLDKSSYNGNAQDLKNEIDKKVNKAGDTFTGAVKIKTQEATQLTLERSTTGNNIVYFSTPSQKKYVGISTSGDFMISDGPDLESYGDNILTTNDKFYRGIVGGNERLRYIQQVGIKNEGLLFIDKETGKVYRCKNNTSDTYVSNNFELATNIELSNKFAQNTRKVYQTAAKRTKEVNVPLSELEKTMFVYIQLDNDTTSKTPASFLIETLDLLDTSVNSSFLYCIPDNFNVDFFYSKQEQKIKIKSNGYIGKVVTYSFYLDI